MASSYIQQMLTTSVVFVGAYMDPHPASVVMK